MCERRQRLGGRIRQALRALKSLPAKATYRDGYKAIRKMLPSQQYPQTPNLYGSTSMKRWKVLG